jgi:molybdopterin converting factor small subunit
MSVTVHIPHVLQSQAEGRETVLVEGKDVGSCLRGLVQAYPGLEPELFRNGRLRNHIEIYVNMESTYPEELAKPVRDGDEIHITLMLSGG